jgi:hypothetical protein
MYRNALSLSTLFTTVFTPAALINIDAATGALAMAMYPYNLSMLSAVGAAGFILILRVIGFLR